MYSEEDVAYLNDEKIRAYSDCNALLEELLVNSGTLEGEAKEHLTHGIARRLTLLSETMNAIFDLIPPDALEHVDRSSRVRAEAFLHAFLTNCRGLIDNMAWFVVKYNQLEIHKNRISLFDRKFKRYLPEMLSVSVGEYKEWYEFLTSQRDPAAHRIPPYIIPYLVLDNGERDYTPLYIHSHREGAFVVLHRQVLSDIGVITGLVRAFIIDYFDVEGV